MQKLICAFSILVLLSACNSTPDTRNGNNNVLPQPTASLEQFSDSLVRLNSFAPTGIEKSAMYFEDLVPADSTLADSAAVILLQYMRRIVDTVDAKLYKDTANYFNLAYGGGEPLSEKEKQYQQYLASHHLNLQGDGEGGVLVVLDYDWVNAIVQPKTSAAVDAYLMLLGEEKRAPALLDAGLAIDMKDLISRLLSSEKLISEKLPRPFSEDIALKNRFYTNALLLGSDNTPSIDYNYIILTPEFKEAYTYLLEAYPSSKAAQKVKEWMAIVKRKDKRKIDEMRAAAYQ